MLNQNHDRIFLSYANEDKEKVIEIYQMFKASGLNPWMDKKDLMPGCNWDREVKLSLENSRFVAIFFSKHSISKRGYVQREFKLALDTLKKIPEDQIFIIPIKLDNCQIPEAFKHIHYVNLNDEKSVSNIIQFVKSEIETFNKFSEREDQQTYIIKEFEEKGIGNHEKREFLFDTLVAVINGKNDLGMINYGLFTTIGWAFLITMVLVSIITIVYMFIALSDQKINEIVYLPIIGTTIGVICIFAVKRLMN